MYFQDVDAGFPIRYRFDGKLLNLRRLQAKSKVQTDVVDKLLYADDLAENAKSEEKMQGAVDRTWKAVQRTNHHCEWTKTSKLLINSPILEALSPEQCTLMMRLQPELQRPV